MKVQYVLEFHVDPSGVGSDLVVTVPIMVGTIPLISTFPTFAPPPTWVAPAPSAPSPYFAPVAPPPYALPNPDHPPPTQGWILPYPPSRPPQGPAKYPDLPPPSYDESMFGPTNVKEEVGPKPLKMVVISFVLHSVKGRVIKSIFLQTKTFKIELFAQVSAIHHRVLISESKITKYCMCCLF